MSRRGFLCFVLTLSSSIVFAPPGAWAQGGVAACAMNNCDTNGDGGRDISDAVRIFAHLFLGSPPPVEYCQGISFRFQNGDCNGDAKLDLSDGVRILSWLFGGLPPPVEEPGDTDGDGIPDTGDNCPLDANSGQEDQDADGSGDACDICQIGNDRADVDQDGAPDACDNCRDSANSAQEDLDQDGHGDVCDNCPQDANPGQEDADGDGIGDVCEVPSGTFAGSLTRTRGRWQFLPGGVGLAGANNLCSEKFPGSMACTFEQLQKAAAAGELAQAVDFTGVPVTTFWVNRKDAAGNRQCTDPTRENISWTYQTGHIAVHGEFVTLSPDGVLSEIQLVEDHCQASRWVGCCRP